MLVLTGGEPLLQLRARPQVAHDFLEALRREGWEVALETNGTLDIPREIAPLITHVTCSPKARVDGGVDHLVLSACHDLKIVVPCPLPIGALTSRIPHTRLFFQPMDHPDHPDSLELATTLARQHGGRVSIQTHKLVGLP